MSGKYFAVGTFVWIASVFLRAVGVDVVLYYQSVLEQSQLLLGVLPVAASVQHFFAVAVAFVLVPVLVLAPVEPAVLFVALAAEVVVVAFVGLFVDAVVVELAAELAVELDAVELVAAAVELAAAAAELVVVAAVNASGVVALFAVVVAFDYFRAKVHC